MLNLLLGTMESGGCEAIFGTFEIAIIFKTDEPLRRLPTGPHTLFYARSPTSLQIPAGQACAQTLDLTDIFQKAARPDPATGLRTCRLPTMNNA